MVGITFFEVGNIAATLLILRATELLAPERGLQSATVLSLIMYLGYNVAAALTSLQAGHATDRLGSLRVLRLGVGVFFFA